MTTSHEITGLSIRKTILLGVLQILSWGGSYYLMAVLTDPIVSDTGWSREWVLGSVSIGLLSAGHVSPMCGRLISRYGGRPVLACHGIFLGAGLWIVASAQTLQVFLIAWILIGIGMAAGLYDALFSALGAIYGPKAHPVITGVTLISGFSTALIWPLLAFAVHLMGWRITCWVYGGILIAVMFPVYSLCLPNQSKQERKSTAEETDEAKIEPHIYFVMTALFSISAALMTAISVIVIVLLQERGHSLSSAIALSTIIGPAAVCCRILDLFTRNKHQKWTMVISVSMTAAGVLTLTFLPAIAACGLALYGAGNGLRAIVRSTLPLAIVPLRDYAIVSSKMAKPVFFSQALTPLACGYLLAFMGAEFTMVILAIISALALTLGMFLMTLTNDSKKVKS